MASINYDNIVPMNLIPPAGGMSKINPLTQKADNYYPANEVPSGQWRTDKPIRHSNIRDTSKGTIDSTIDINSVEQPKITAKAVQHYADACAEILRGGAAIGNGYLAKMSAQSKEMAYNFKAKQNRRAAELLLMNQVDITRAAQMDANQYYITGKETKAAQKTAMASTGFAVGKGVYKNTINTTEARVNYNVANLMMKADLENAELTRKAGYQLAEAVINDANAAIAAKEGNVAVLNGWVNGISNFISAGANFYCGRIENGALSPATKTQTNGTKKS